MTDVARIMSAHATRHLTLARQRAGLTQQNLADRLAVSRQAVSAWESADGAVSLTTLCRWLDALDQPLQLGEPRVLCDATTDTLPDRPDRHIAVTGDGAAAGVPLLADLNPGCWVKHLGAGNDDAIAELTAELTWTAGEPGIASGMDTVVLYVDEMTDEQLAAAADLQASCWAARWVAIVVSTDGHIPERMLANCATRLHTDDGHVFRGEQDDPDGTRTVRWWAP